MTINDKSKEKNESVAAETDQSTLIKANDSKVLTILPEFEKLTNLMYTDRSPVANGERKYQNNEQAEEESKKVRLELLKNRMLAEGKISPFKVWKHDGKLILIDSRYDEYRIAVELILPFETIEYEFATIKEAEANVIINQLIKPNLSGGHRIMLARRLKDIYKKQARKNQGKRNDLLLSFGESQKSFNTAKTLASIANVGEQTFTRFDQIIEKGPEYFGQEKTDEFIDRIVNDKISINAVWEKYQNAKNTKKVVDEYNQKQDLKGNGQNVSKKSNSDDQNDDNYINPSIEDEFQNKIVCGDHIDILKQLPDACVNLVLTSPVYNVPKVKYDVDIPVLPQYEYLDRLGLQWTEAARILTDGGRLVINVPALVSVFGESSDRAFNTPLFMDVVQQIKDLNISLNFRDIIVWNKVFPYKKNPLSTVSPANPCLRAHHEYLLVFSKNDWAMKPENSDAPHDLTMENYMDWSSSVWTIPPQSKGMGNHPAVFPEELAERAIRMFSFVGDTVIDFNLGSGTTTAVAARLGRKWFGCDLSPKYCKVASARTEKAYKQFLNNIPSDKETSVKKVSKKAA